MQTNIASIKLRHNFTVVIKPITNVVRHAKHAVASTRVQLWKRRGRHQGAAARNKKDSLDNVGAI